MGRHRDLDKKSFCALGGKAYTQPAVVIDPNIVTGAFDFTQILPKLIEREWRASALDALGKVVIEAPLNKSAKPAVHGGIRPARLEYNVMLCPADMGVL